MSKGFRQLAMVLAAVALLIASILLGLRQEPGAVAAAPPAPTPLAPAAPGQAAAEEPAAAPAEVAQVWSVAEVSQSPALVAAMGLALDQCRNLRVDFATGKADAASGSDLLVGGRATTCDDLFSAYAGKMAELLAPLRQSADPLQRGYFYDGRYSDLANEAYLRFVATDDPAIGAQRAAYEKKTDAHFEDVLKDADTCSLDSMIRLFLSQKLTSARYNTQESRFFTASILAALEAENAAIQKNLQMQGAGLPAARTEEVKKAVFGAMTRCGTGNFATAIAPYFSKG